MISKCLNCKKPFEEGDKLKAFLRSPSEVEGSWGGTITVDAKFQYRMKRNRDRVKRKHSGDCP